MIKSTPEIDTAEVSFLEVNLAEGLGGLVLGVDPQGNTVVVGEQNPFFSELTEDLQLHRLSETVRDALSCAFFCSLRDDRHCIEIEEVLRFSDNQPAVDEQGNSGAVLWAPALRNGQTQMEAIYTCSVIDEKISHFTHFSV